MFFKQVNAFTHYVIKCETCLNVDLNQGSRPGLLYAWPHDLCSIQNKPPHLGQLVSVRHSSIFFHKGSCGHALWLLPIQTRLEASLLLWYPEWLVSQLKQAVFCPPWNVHTQRTSGRYVLWAMLTSRWFKLSYRIQVFSEEAMFCQKLTQGDINFPVTTIQPPMGARSITSYTTKLAEFVSKQSLPPFFKHILKPNGI